VTAPARTMGCLQFVREVIGAPLTPGQSAMVACQTDGVPVRDLPPELLEAGVVMFGGWSTPWPESSRHMVARVCGAGGGKSYVGALECVWATFTLPCHPRPGEVMSSVMVAPDIRLARVPLRFAMGAIESVPALARRVIAKTSDSITIKRRDGISVTIECLPATHGGAATRGRRYVRALLDESDFFRGADSGRVNDKDVVDSVATRIIAGGQTVLSSTPWIEGVTALGRIWKANFGNPTSAIAARAPTLLLLDTEQNRAMSEREHERDEDNWRREFRAEWLAAGAGLFFDGDSLDRCIRPLPPLDGGRAFAGADLGFSHDHSALVVVRVEGGRVHVTGLEEYKPRPGQPLVPTQVCGDFASIARRLGASILTSDGHYSQVMVEGTRHAGIQWMPSSSSVEAKLKAHVRVKEIIGSGRLVIDARLPLAQRFAEQLKAIIAKPLPGGAISFSSPRSVYGGHGDLASAGVLAIALAFNATAGLGATGGGGGYPQFSPIRTGFSWQ